MDSISQPETISMPRIGDKAPAFKAVTTQGDIDFPAQYVGSWVILFSHPADFTPVCTSEFMTFASLEDQFAQANCKVRFAFKSRNRTLREAGHPQRPLGIRDSL